KVLGISRFFACAWGTGPARGSHKDSDPPSPSAGLISLLVASSLPIQPQSVISDMQVRNDMRGRGQPGAFSRHSSAGSRNLRGDIHKFRASTPLLSLQNSRATFFPFVALFTRKPHDRDNHGS